MEKANKKLASSNECVHRGPHFKGLQQQEKGKRPTTGVNPPLTMCDNGRFPSASPDGLSERGSLAGA
jgi:hypothetical protein